MLSWADMPADVFCLKEEIITGPVHRQSARFAISIHGCDVEKQIQPLDLSIDQVMQNIFLYSIPLALFVSLSNSFVLLGVSNENIAGPIRKELENCIVLQIIFHFKNVCSWMYDTKTSEYEVISPDIRKRKMCCEPLGCDVLMDKSNARHSKHHNICKIYRRMINIPCI